MDSVFAIWDFELAIIQVVVLIALFELPAIILRRTRWAYTPIYFMFFPFGHADHLYAKYFAEDYFYMEGESLNEVELKTLRYRIVSVATISTFISTMITPFVIGVVSAYLVTGQNFSDFLKCLVAIKLVLLTFSFLNFCQTSIGDSWSKRLSVVIIYTVYLVLAVSFLRWGYEYSDAIIKIHGTIPAILGITKNLMLEILLPMIVVPVVTAAVTYNFCNKDIRKHNLENNHE